MDTSYSFLVRARPLMSDPAQLHLGEKNPPVEEGGKKSLKKGGIFCILVAF
jgi:hypothetical protein